MSTSTRALLALLALSVHAAAGQKFDYPADAPIFSITYPDSWNVEAEEQTISAGMEDGSVSSVLMALDAGDVGAALDAAAAALDETFEDFTADGEPQEGQVNGMDVWLSNGTAGVDGGGKVKVNLAIFTPDKEKFFMLFIFTPEGVAGRQAEEINSLLQSIARE